MSQNSYAKLVYMDSICKKKYTDFEEFNKDCSLLVEYVSNNTQEKDVSQKILYARKVFTREVLNSCLTVGCLNENIVKLLGSRSNILKISMDNMIKNRLAHPEVTNQDYLKILSIVKNPSKYYKTKSGYDVILFKEDEKCYKLVIKTTKNRKENFVKSLHLLNKERYEKY